MPNLDRFQSCTPPRRLLARWATITLASCFIATCLLAMSGLLPPIVQWAAAAETDAADVTVETDATAADDGTDDSQTPDGASQQAGSMNLLAVLLEGGWFFLTVLGLMSLMVVTMTIERFIALRRGRVLPRKLTAALNGLGNTQGGFDPRQADHLCRQFPSAAATVIRAMLSKVGRPTSEVQHAVRETSEREADRMYANVRWLTLAVAIAPLVGLLGTVWGMILAFHQTTQLAPDQSKAEQLAHGIWTALVTTMCGLVIAITAAIFAHYFEGRITALFHQIDELLFNLLPQIERFEGRQRFGVQADQAAGDGRSLGAGENEPAQARQPAIPK